MLAFMKKDMRLITWLMVLLYSYAIAMFLLQFLDPEMRKESEIAYVAVVLLPFALMLGQSLETLKLDYKCGFDRYASAMPGGVKRYVGSKFIQPVFCGLAAVLFGLVERCILLAADVSCYPIWVLFAIFFAFLFMLTLLLPASMLVGAERSEMLVFLMLAVVIFGIVVYVLFGDISWFLEGGLQKMLLWTDQHRTQVYGYGSLAALVITVLYYGAYRLAVVWYRRA